MQEYEDSGCYNTLTPARIPRLGLFHNTLTPAWIGMFGLCRKTLKLARIQMLGLCLKTDTCKNTKTPAVLQIWHQQEHQRSICVTKLTPTRTPILGLIKPQNIDSNKNTKARALSFASTPTRTPRLGLCHKTLTPARTSRFGVVCHKILTPARLGLYHKTLTPVKTSILRVGHETLTPARIPRLGFVTNVDTSKNTDAWAVLTHWHHFEHKESGWYQECHRCLGCITTHWHQ